MEIYLGPPKAMLILLEILSTGQRIYKLFLLALGIL